MSYQVTEHPFYQKSSKEKRAFYFKLVFFAILANALLSLLFYLVSPLILPLGFLFIAISLSCLAPFIDTPSLVKSGKLGYLSPMLLMEKEKHGVVKLHGGTLLDYTFLFQKDWPTNKRRKFVMREMISGLIELLKKLESDEKQIVFRGSSYILNAKTLRRFGFETQSVDGFQYIILILNFAPLTIAKSMVDKRLSFPNLSNVNTFEISYADLKAHKEKLYKLREKL
ncbi:hypothetical protein GCM10027429_19200 [Marivirga atlantica]|uniref:Uncharacterized protein n=1 Tax=Marivirga atlantica TaxID=1548457 RepID=A0A937AMR0_9BACT|nr:hypothetical protein [Marivirga atlantica]MBL0765537.1 hypothetical protein [Marivirga atlantica]